MTKILWFSQIAPARAGSGKQEHFPAIEDLNEVLNYQPEVLVIGPDVAGCAKVSQSMLQSLECRTIRVIAKTRQDAYPILKWELNQGKRAAGVFHRTCESA
ncbi:MAG: hypothetical protein NC930_02105 [Candidatus Omnitrophica bacterium]|nr:hypothetical protein [Candidatus Omnitrophota bacterium]